MKYERVQLLSLKTIILKLVNVIFSQMLSTLSRTRLIFILSSDTGHKLRKETVLKQQENIILM